MTVQIASNKIVRYTSSLDLKVASRRRRTILLYSKIDRSTSSYYNNCKSRINLLCSHISPGRSLSESAASPQQSDAVARNFMHFTKYPLFRNFLINQPIFSSNPPPPPSNLHFMLFSTQLLSC